MYPNIHLPWLASQILPHNRVEFVVSSSPQPLLLIHVLLFPCLYKNRHVKIPIWPRIRVFSGLFVNTLNLFIQSEFAKTTQNFHDNFFQVELAHQRKRRKEKCVFFVTCLPPVCLFCESNFWSLIDDARKILTIRPMRNYINVLIWFNGFLDTLKDMNNVKRL